MSILAGILQGGGSAPQGQLQYPGQGVTAAENKAYQVYLGDTKLPSSSSYNEQVPHAAGANTQPDTTTLDDANTRIYDMGTYKKFEQYLLSKGLIKPGQYTVNDVVSTWQDAVQQSALFLSRGTKMTPYQYVDMNAGLSGVSSGPTTNTSHATSVNDLDPASVRSALDSTFSSLLGRNPSNSEREQFLAKMSGLNKAHPSVTTTTTTSTPAKGGDSTSSSKTSSSGGFTAQDVIQAAQDSAKALPEFGAHEAATTAYSWLQSAIQGG